LRRCTDRFPQDIPFFQAQGNGSSEMKNYYSLPPSPLFRLIFHLKHIIAA